MEPFVTEEKETEFRRELGRLLNQYSRENPSDTPDFILAEYLALCLTAFDISVRERERWYGRYVDGLPGAPGQPRYPRVSEMPRNPLG